MKNIIQKFKNYLNEHDIKYEFSEHDIRCLGYGFNFYSNTACNVRIVNVNKSIANLTLLHTEEYAANQIIKFLEQKRVEDMAKTNISVCIDDIVYELNAETGSLLIKEKDCTGTIGKENIPTPVYSVIETLMRKLLAMKHETPAETPAKIVNQSVCKSEEKSAVQEKEPQRKIVCLTGKKKGMFFAGMNFQKSLSSK